MIKAFHYLTILCLGLALFSCGGPGTGTTTGTTTGTGDTTPPTFSVSPASTNITVNTFQVTATLDEAGTFYIAVFASGTAAPDSTAVKAGTGALKTASKTVLANTKGTVEITGLAPSTTYDVYAVAEDTAKNLMGTPIKLAVTTAIQYTKVSGLSFPTTVTNNQPSFVFRLTTQNLSNSLVTNTVVNASGLGGSASLKLYEETPTTFTNKITVSQGLGAIALSISIYNDKGSVLTTNYSVNVICPVTIYFLNSYRYTDPVAWFWKSAAGGSDLVSSGTTNIGAYTYKVYKKYLNAAGSYYFKMKEGTAGTVWEDSISVESVQRGFSLSASATPAQYFSVGYWRKVFTTIGAMTNSFALCPFNMTNQFTAGYVMPGAQPVTGGYIFSIFAPRSSSVNVAGTFNSWSATTMPLKFDPNQGYWWIKTNGLVTTGGNYKFVLNGTIWDGADPYARSFNAMDNDNPIIPSTNFTWGDSGFTRPNGMDKLVIYETHIKDISRDETGSVYVQKGTYTGMLKKIPYLKRLGINAVELMPIQEWPGGWYSWGYNNCGFYAPENSLSTNQANASAYYDLKTLIDQLHQNGIAVILDVVYNHHANDKNYLWTIDNDYYFDPAGTPWGNKIQMKNPMVQKFFLDNLKYWADEFHVDGFRFDSTENIDIDGLLAIIKKLKDNGYGNRYYIFEEFNGGHNSSIQIFNSANGNIIASWGTGYRNAAWDAIVDGSSGSSQGTGTYYSKDNGFTHPRTALNYVGSHDEGTLAGKSAPKAAVKVAMAHLLTSMGVPMIWMGDEFMRVHYGNTPPSGSGIDEANNLVNWSFTNSNADLLNFTAALVKLRIAHESLRQNIADPGAAGKFDWCIFDWNTAPGYNYKATSGDNDFTVLINYSTSAKLFTAKFSKTGNWYLMCDGTSATNAAPGLATWNIAGATSNISVPARTAYIFMSAVANP